MKHAETAKTLNSLINTLKDGQEGYRLAAEGSAELELKRLFHEFSLQRAKFAGELQMLVRELGTEYETSPSVLGALHRGWINMKTALTSGSDRSLLEECERGEDKAVAEFTGALDTELPAHVRAAVTRQAAEIKAAHDQIRALRDHAIAMAA